MDEPKRKMGFALLDAETRREMARKGGKTSHKLGKGHRFTSEEARAASFKGVIAKQLKKERGIHASKEENNKNESQENNKDQEN